MPEGPEVRVIAQQWNDALGKIIKKVDHTHNKKYKWERDGIPGLELIGPGWEVNHLQVKGKLTRVDFKKGEEHLSMLNTLGLEGFWSWNSDHKHKRVWFEFEDGSKLYYVDSRNFGTIRFMSTREADKKMSKIGWDLLIAPMAPEDWRKLQSKKSVGPKPIGEALMNQQIFSGIGNIYKAETLYELKINPATLVEDLDPTLWDQVNYKAHAILDASYQVKGSSVKSYDGGSFQRSLKIYKKKTCPSGHIVSSVEQAKRTTWYCPICQK